MSKSGSDAAGDVRRARRALQYVKGTALSGFVLLVPLAVLLFLLTKAAPLLRALARPLEGLLPMETVVGVLIADAIAAAILFAVCFVAGLLARFSFANRFVRKAESGLLWRIPGYSAVKALIDGVEGGASSLRPVLIHFDDAAQLAFEVDRLPDGRRIVYVPDAPQPRSGSLLIMDANRVEPVPMTFLAALRGFRELGRGVATSLPVNAPADTSSRDG
jgi:uncharacterized membrane protein